MWVYVCWGGGVLYGKGASGCLCSLTNCPSVNVLYRYLEQIENFSSVICPCVNMTDGRAENWNNSVFLPDVGGRQTCAKQSTNEGASKMDVQCVRHQENISQETEIPFSSMGLPSEGERKVKSDHYTYIFSFFPFREMYKP